MKMFRLLALMFILLFGGPAHAGPDTVSDIADAVLDLRRMQDLHLWAQSGRDGAGWPDRTSEGVAETEKREDALLARLRALPAEAISAEESVLYASMVEDLEARQGERVCRRELWDVNHMVGWHRAIAPAVEQAYDGGADAALLAAWRGFPSYVTTEIENLRTGLALGYSAPRSVVARVVAQLDGLIAPIPVAQAAIDGSPGQASREQMILEPLIAYRKFLATEYALRAREALALSANRDGATCYEALIRTFTTLPRTPRQIYELGLNATADNEAAILRLGAAAADEGVLAVVRRMEAADPGFSSEAELVAYSADSVERGRKGVAPYFTAMPAQTVRTVPTPPVLRGSGSGTRYERRLDPATPAMFWLSAEAWEVTSRAEAESTAFHETYPGHHLQTATANAQLAHPLGDILINAAYSEGWARYGERLAEEADLYSSVAPSILRRAWSARGLVADPGLHVFGWTRDQTIDYLVASGAVDADAAAAMVDRMAAIPAQLVAYDTGALEILALRAKAQKQLGAAFSIAEFHDIILKPGPAPLATLARQVDMWIQNKRVAADTAAP